MLSSSKVSFWERHFEGFAPPEDPQIWSK